MKYKKFEVGKLYKIRFHDHFLTDSVEDLMVIEVCGWVRRCTGDTLSISTWETITDNDAVKKDNDEIYNIARKLILSSRLIK